MGCKSCRSRKMLENEYLDAKIGLDTEENEPSKVCRYQPTTPPTVICTALVTPSHDNYNLGTESYFVPIYRPHIYLRPNRGLYKAGYYM